MRMKSLIKAEYFIAFCLHINSQSIIFKNKNNFTILLFTFNFNERWLIRFPIFYAISYKIIKYTVHITFK